MDRRISDVIYVTLICRNSGVMLGVPNIGIVMTLENYQAFLGLDAKDEAVWPLFGDHLYQSWNEFIPTKKKYKVLL